MGVWGREPAEELAPPDSLDCGRRRPVLIANGFAGVLWDGDVERLEEAVNLKDVGAGPLERRRFSRKRSLSLRGDGESSIINTQPVESDSLPLFFSLSKSWLFRESILFL